MKMKSLKLSIIILLIIFISGCANKAATETAKPTRDDLGCFPPSCSLVKDPYGKQLCEDWKAGKELSWPPDCKYAQTPACIRLCEKETNGTKKLTPPIPENAAPTGTPPSGANYPQGSQSPADFLYHSRDPVCVDDTDYHSQLVYARPSDRPDRYSEISATQQKWMRQANGIVNSEAEKFGMTADIKFACSGGLPTVLNVILPKSEAAYNTHDGKTTEAIAASMRQLGYDDKKIKYLIYYDGNADGCEGGKQACSGQFSAKTPDDSLSENNAFNSGPDYSALYDGGLKGVAERAHTEIDFLAPIVMLHEYTHTLGAVQASSPNSAHDDVSQGTVGHCKDEPPMEQQGNDVMCRSDDTATVFDDTCKDSGFSMHYDCKNDDYFNPKPSPGSYLATHWNLGSPLNHFFKFGTK